MQNTKKVKQSIIVKQETVGGTMQNVYLVSEGNGGQNMKYVPENEILTLLNG